MRQVISISILFTLLYLFGSLEFCYTQTYSYGYDDNGNRISRTIPLNTTKSTSPQYQQETKKVYNEKLGDLEINLFPNPTKGEITVTLKNFKESESSVIYLFDNSGKLVDTYNDIQPINSFDFSELSRGIYILRIIVGEQKTEWKVVKE